MNANEAVLPRKCTYCRDGMYRLDSGREISCPYCRRYDICGVVSESGPNGEPLACGHKWGHSGPHAWSSLPTFTWGGSSR